MLLIIAHLSSENVVRFSRTGGARARSGLERGAQDTIDHHRKPKKCIIHIYNSFKINLKINQIYAQLYKNTKTPTK